MRPLYVLVVWVVILGGLWLYTAARDAVSPSSTPAIEIQPAPGIYELELTPTFDAAPAVDPFATDTGVQPTVKVSLRGRQIVRYDEPIKSGIPLRFSWDTRATPLELEKNELLVELLTPPQDSTMIGEEAKGLRGVRVHLLRDGETIADEMIWSQPGAPVVGDVDLVIKPQQQADEHDH